MHHLPELSGLLSRALHYSAACLPSAGPVAVGGGGRVRGGGVVVEFPGGGHLATPPGVSPGQPPAKLGYTVGGF